VSLRNSKRRPMQTAPASAQTTETLNGFSIGMPKNAALSVLNNRGVRLVKVRGTDNSYITEANDTRFQSVTFCRDAVFSYSMDIAGGVDAFIRSVFSETAKRGQAQYEVRSSETSAGPWNMLSMVWPAGSTLFKVDLSRIGGADQVSLSITNAAACKP
jgi:hypothetical protein